MEPNPDPIRAAVSVALGEGLAAEHLERAGYAILERNFRAPAASSTS